MKDKTVNPKEKETMKDKDNPMTEMAGKALKNCEQAFLTGLKLQEEAVQYWTHLFNQTVSPQDWQKRAAGVTDLASGVLPAAQKQMDEVLDLVEKNTRTGAELMTKAIDAAQTPVIAQSQAKWLDFWTASVGAVRTSADALTQFNARVADSWVELIRQNTEVTQVRVPKTA